MIYGKGIKPEIRQEPGGQTDVAPTLLGLLNMSYTQNDFGINLLTEQRPYVYFSADNLIAATDTTHLYIYSPHDRQEFKYKKQGNALQLVTGGGQYILRDEKILFLHIAECGVSGKRAQDCQ